MHTGVGMMDLIGENQNGFASVNFIYRVTDLGAKYSVIDVYELETIMQMTPISKTDISLVVDAAFWIRAEGFINQHGELL